MRLALALLLVTTSAHADPQTIAVCSPGTPGTTADAQPTLDAFAKEAATKSGVALAAVYDQTDDAGAKRLATAGLALVSLPFFLKHEKDLGLHARLDAVQKGRTALDRWTLVAKKGRVASAAALDGWTIVTTVAFAPAFVRGAALGGFGALPASTKLVASASVLSALRKAANGDNIAVLLDGTQAAALPSLPYAADLAVVASSAPMPAGVIATIDARVPAKTWAALEPAFRALRSDQTAAAVLDTMGLDHFEPIDDKALAAARDAYASAAK